MSTVNTFLIKCKQHRSALKQSKQTFVKLHHNVTKLEGEVEQAKTVQQKLHTEETHLKRRLIAASLEYDSELAEKEQLQMEISKARNTLFKLKKQTVRVDQQESSAKLSFDKCYTEHTALEAEAKKWSQKLSVMNKDRIQQYDDWNSRREKVERYKDEIHDLKHELEAIKKIVGNTLRGH
jgi:chromosome segregation ATPase